MTSEDTELVRQLREEGGLLATQAANRIEVLAEGLTKAIAKLELCIALKDEAIDIAKSAVAIQRQRGGP